jgi:hypothetical protein
MKLGEFLKYFEPFVDVVIWHTAIDEEEPVYCGTIFDVPYGYIDCELVDKDSDKDYDGIILSQDLDGRDNPNPQFNHMAGLVLEIDG